MATDWSRPFEEPIFLPGERQLLTLLHAGIYINGLSKAEQQLDEWQTAISCLLGAAEGRNSMMHACLNKPAPAAAFPEVKGPHQSAGQVYVVANFWAGTLTNRIAYSFDGQEVPPTPA